MPELQRVSDFVILVIGMDLWNYDSQAFAELAARPPGRRVRDIGTGWDAACRRVALRARARHEGKTVGALWKAMPLQDREHFKKGLNRLVHDLRRTAVRNLVRAGVSEKVAMELTGHLTRSVFDRYNITDDRDRRDAVRKLAAVAPDGQVLSIPDPFRTQRAAQGDRVTR
jgi:hypothetical protein